MGQSAGGRLDYEYLGESGWGVGGLVGVQEVDFGLGDLVRVRGAAVFGS